jgi:hypothetical protein
VPNNTPRALKDITLRWMVREIIKSQCGIQFDTGALQRADVELSFNNAANEARDQNDALQPIHDQLKIDPLWWILEILPMTYTWQEACGAWKSSFGCVKNCWEQCDDRMKY